VKGEDSIFPKLGAIELQSLSGQQVGRDRIRAERVQDDEPIRVIRRVAEPQPRIAQDHGDRGRSTAGEKCEETSVPRDFRNDWIDLKEGHALAGLGITCQ
jgi:hypothetical protein